MIKLLCRHDVNFCQAGKPFMLLLTQKLQIQYHFRQAYGQKKLSGSTFVGGSVNHSTAYFYSEECDFNKYANSALERF